MPNLSDAISAAETSLAAYSNAVTATANDQAFADGIKAKLDVAAAQVSSDKSAEAPLATDANSKLDDLIAAATAAKIPASGN